ncbi:MAG: hypothetical protein ACKVY0_05310 [Prosthecobacter sp.]|uniref:hypothetical protein n=1 Tax=Prosthecobacter sp. TaxID=1965333 RepID=UPI003901753F
MSKLLCAALLVVLASCDDALNSKPANSELLGLWTCKQLPAKFLKNIGSPASVVSSIQLNGDGSFTAQSIAKRSPDRLTDLQGKWSIVDPSMTPSGKWSVEIDGYFFRLARKGGKLVLEQSIDVLKGYEAEFERKTSR